MSKPHWENAPDWAQWLAQEQYGIWYWYKEKPSLFYFESPLGLWGCWLAAPVDGEVGMYEFAGDGGINPYWRNTLEARPCL